MRRTGQGMPSGGAVRWGTDPGSSPPWKRHFFFFTRPSLPGPVRLSARRSLDFSPHYKNAELLPEVRGTRHETHFSNIWLIRFSSQSYLKKKKKKIPAYGWN